MNIYKAKYKINYNTDYKTEYGTFIKNMAEDDLLAVRNI